MRMVRPDPNADNLALTMLEEQALTGTRDRKSSTFEHRLFEKSAVFQHTRTKKYYKLFQECIQLELDRAGRSSPVT